MNSTTKLLSILMGGRFALELERNRIAIDDLTAALGGWPWVNSLADQERAYSFFLRHGGRTTKRYAASLLRQRYKV